MELSGDEKRIQALFSELSLEEHTLVPRFEKLWLRAETNARVPAAGMMRPVIVTVIVLAVAGLVAASSWYTSSTDVVSIPAQTIPTAPRVKEPEKLLSATSRTSPTRRVRRPIRPRQTERVTTTLANWQSPTNIFLQSPTTLALSSLPQLNQSAQDLEKFLPKNNETMKESKQ